MLQWIAGAAAGYFLYKGWQKKVAAQNISVNFSALRGIKFNPLKNQLDIIAIVNIVNPSAENLTINHIAGFATLDGYNLGNFVSQGKTINISARGTTRVDIPISFNLINLAGQVLQLVNSMVSGGSFNKALQVNSVINVLGINVPLQFSTPITSNLITF